MKTRQDTIHPVLRKALRLYPSEGNVWTDSTYNLLYWSTPDSNICIGFTGKEKKTLAAMYYMVKILDNTVVRLVTDTVTFKNESELFDWLKEHNPVKTLQQFEDLNIMGFSTELYNFKTMLALENLSDSEYTGELPDMTDPVFDDTLTDTAMFFQYLSDYFDLENSASRPDILLYWCVNGLEIKLYTRLGSTFTLLLSFNKSLDSANLNNLYTEELVFNNRKEAFAWFLTHNLKTEQTKYNSLFNRDRFEQILAGYKKECNIC